jgi:sortase A
VSVTGEPTVYALLEAPSIGLVAPVVDGTEEPQLSVALGHVMGRSWPGPTGTAVLEGHDVTWFSHLGNLKAGDAVTVATPCRTMSYQVQTSQVVPAGTPILQTTESRLVLVTCYPLDSLSLTTQRLVVTANLTGIVSRVATTGKVAAPLAPIVPAPAALEAQGLDLVHNPAPMGTLSLAGTPTVAWQQSAEPLADEQSVITLYFAALRSAEQDQRAWWTAVAPTVPFDAAAPLVGATVSHNDSTFSPVLQVTGTSFTGATLTVDPVLSGGTEPGLDQITMTATVVGYQLLVSGWTVTRR